MFLETPHDMAVGVAARFRRVRKAKGMTIKKLSEKSGVPYSTIRRFEKTGEISFMSFVKMTSAMNEDAEITGLFRDWLPSTVEEALRESRR